MAVLRSGEEKGAQRKQGKAVEWGRGSTGVLARADEWQLCIGLGRPCKESSSPTYKCLELLRFSPIKHQSSRRAA